MTNAPLPVAPNQPIRASTINAIIELALQKTAIKAGRGLTMTRIGEDTVLSLASSAAEWAKLATITAATGQAIDLPANVKYAAVEVGNPAGTIGVDGGPVAPDFGRPTKESWVRVARAEVGTPCVILRVPLDGGGTVALLALFAGSETLAFARCSDGGNGPMGGGPDDVPPINVIAGAGTRSPVAPPVDV